MHSKSMGIQIADAVTSSYFYAVETSADGYTEEAYVRLLLPRACRRAGELFGHGVRFKHSFCYNFLMTVGSNVSFKQAAAIAAASRQGGLDL